MSDNYTDDTNQYNENLPIAIHNNRVYAISKTFIDFDDFLNFVNSKEREFLKEKYKMTFLNLKNPKNI